MKENDREQELIPKKKAAKNIAKEQPGQQGVVCTIYARVISSF